MAGSKLTNDFGKTVVERLTTDSPTRSLFSKFKIGIGTTAASQSDTDLENAVPFGSTELVDGCGVADWNDNGNCTTSVNTSLYKQGTAALNIVKDAAGSAECSTSKTTTSLNFTDKALSIWLYIKDSTALSSLAETNAVYVRFGSDSSNYYQWNKDRDFFSTGWNLINSLTGSSSTSTVGSPSLAAMDYSYIALNGTASATTWASGDFIMDDWKLVSAGDLVSDEVTSYPTPNLSTLEETHRLYVSSTQANGYLISEVGIFNSDSTRLMSTRGLFTAVSKSNTDELIILVKNKLRINETV